MENGESISWGIQCTSRTVTNTVLKSVLGWIGGGGTLNSLFFKLCTLGQNCTHLKMWRERCYIYVKWYVFRNVMKNSIGEARCSVFETYLKTGCSVSVMQFGVRRHGTKQGEIAYGMWDYNDYMTLPSPSVDCLTFALQWIASAVVAAVCAWFAGFLLALTYNWFGRVVQKTASSCVLDGKLTSQN